MSDKPSFIDELKRRNVIRVVSFYLIGAWLPIRMAGIGLPVFELGDIR